VKDQGKQEGGSGYHNGERYASGSDKTRSLLSGSLAESLPILAGADKRLNHFCLHKVAIELVKLVKPEPRALLVRVAPESINRPAS
jgi:hypothetical protein